MGTLRGEEFGIFSGDRARTFPWKVFTRARLSAPPSSGRGGMRGKNGDSSAENEKSHPLGRGDIDAGCKNILFHAFIPAFFPSSFFRSLLAPSPLPQYFFRLPFFPSTNRRISHFLAIFSESRRDERKENLKSLQIARDRERQRILSSSKIST